MAYYTVGRPARITCDASPIGLGAILEQQQTDGVWKPVYYASRKLTPTETGYSQFEREALGVFWAWVISLACISSDVNSRSLQIIKHW